MSKATESKTPDTEGSNESSKLSSAQLSRQNSEMGYGSGTDGLNDKVLFDIWYTYMQWTILMNTDINSLSLIWFLLLFLGKWQFSLSSTKEQIETAGKF